MFRGGRNFGKAIGWKKPPVADYWQDFAKRFKWASVRRERKRGSGRLRRGTFCEESKDPCPVSGAGPSILRGLFHPNVSKLSHLRCAKISVMLILG